MSGESFMVDKRKSTPLPLNYLNEYRLKQDKKMSELDQLKQRIKDSGPEGITTAIIKDDYEPAGEMMIRNLVDSGEFISRRHKPISSDLSQWKVWAKGFEPY